MTIDTDLATLREHLPADYLGPDPNDMDGEKWGQHPEALAALDRVEAELARLREAESQARYYREKYEERAEELEIELARLREGLRPESLARLFHETYERLAPEHGYKTREASAVPWEDVPEANRVLMIATADAVARALLAEDGAA